MTSTFRTESSAPLPWTARRAASAPLDDAARPLAPRPDWALRRSSLPFQSCEGAGWHEDDLVAENVRVRKGQPLVRSGQPATSLYAIRSGSCKSVVGAPGGQQQITGFHIAGEVVGAEAVCGAAYDATVTALEDSEFRVTALRPRRSARPGQQRLPGQVPRIPGLRDQARAQDVAMAGHHARGAAAVVLSARSRGSLRRARLLVARPRAADVPRRDRQPSRAQAGNGQPPVLAAAPGRARSTFRVARSSSWTARRCKGWWTAPRFESRCSNGHGRVCHE